EIRLVYFDVVNPQDTGGVLMIDMGSVVGNMFAPVGAFLGLVIKIIVCGGCALLFGALAYFFVRYHFNPLRLRVDDLRAPYIKNKWLDLFLMKEKYPKCIIVTNFAYYRSDHIMTDWRDMLTLRNGTDGIIFAIDEIHSEYSAKSWNDVPESLLSEVSQQRKQRVKIVATAQFFTRVAKPLREQAATVVSCSTWAGRLTRNREYDALQYAMVIENPVAVKRKVKPLHKASFVQSDALRACYDTFEKIRRMEKIQFSPRKDRGEN
ncbi:MAG: hypothetical protein KHZ71_14900, partial [Anaerotruncus colihominis]|uniref:zonular occludens toxin domain-containing protein n=1 Tax=Anaerotruncus colihominis TaxID=169435 RepID=UPI001DAF771B